jgi:5'-nucleotidase (lipoprotein e(P4) family)
MSVKRSASRVVRCAMWLAAGLVLGSAAVQVAAPGSASCCPKSIPYTMREKLGATLYMQTAAEYRACCLQTFRLAEQRLAALMAAKPDRPAVVMDLDETVLDNSAFESYLHETNQEISDQTWAFYEREYPAKVLLVPGAKVFIEKAEAMGVTVVYISNRSEEWRPSTIKALRLLGLNTNGMEGRLHLMNDISDKTQRRERVAAKHNVLLLFGDNLQDFSEIFVATKVKPEDGADGYHRAIQARFDRVDAEAAHFGQDWFIFPNPVYGEWERLIGNDPMRRLRPSGMN